VGEQAAGERAHAPVAAHGEGARLRHLGLDQAAQHRRHLAVEQARDTPDLQPIGRRMVVRVGLKVKIASRCAG
jgi:hypothetical protein